MQYGHVYTAFCIIIKLKVMFWKLYTRIDFNVGTFKVRNNVQVILLIFRIATTTF